MGRLRDFTAPGSAGIGFVFAFAGPPRSACSVSWSRGTACPATASNEQGFEPAGTFCGPGAPADTAQFDKTAATDTGDYLDTAEGPFRQPRQPDDIPRPGLVGGLALPAGYDKPDGGVGVRQPPPGGQYPVHRADPARAGAFVRQGGKDLGRGPICKTGCGQMGKHLNRFAFRQGTR